MTASATMPAANAAAPVKKNSNFQAIVKRLFQNRGAVIGLIIFIVLALAAIFAPVAAPTAMRKWISPICCPARALSICLEPMSWAATSSHALFTAAATR